MAGGRSRAFHGMDSSMVKATQSYERASPLIIDPSGGLLYSIRLIPYQDYRDRP